MQNFNRLGKPNSDHGRKRRERLNKARLAGQNQDQSSGDLSSENNGIVYQAGQWLRSLAARLTK